MSREKEVLYELLHEIKELIDHSEREDGIYTFDVKRVQIALDFTKRELKSSISEASEENTER